MRLFVAVTLGLMLSTGRGWAQEDNVTTATTALQDVLSNLKQSVGKLAVDNEQLSTRDNTIRKQVLDLQMQLGQIVAQGDVLNKSVAALQDKNPRRAEEITRLEKENYDLDDQAQKAEGGIKLIQQTLNAGYQEDQRLLLQLKQMKDQLPAPPLVAQSPENQLAEHRQKEKLKLMKMIYDSQQRQEALHELILEAQKNTPLLPAANAMAHQELLKEQIKDLQMQLDAYPQEKTFAGPVPVDQWDDNQLHQLEDELGSLEHDYAQLKELTGLMGKKAQGGHLSVGEHIEEEKLQNKINDLTHQGEGLRADLDDLRSQMVDLDKRKSRLEVMIQQLH